MVKFEIIWSVKARIDLLIILEFYTVRNGNSFYSRKINSKIKRCTAQISRNPRIGIETQLENVRYYITMDYEVVYKIIDDKIRIIMIWDCRMNPENRNIESRI